MGGPDTHTRRVPGGAHVRLAVVRWGPELPVVCVVLVHSAGLAWASVTAPHSVQRLLCGLSLKPLKEARSLSHVLKRVSS